MEDTVVKVHWAVAQRLPDAPAIHYKDRTGKYTALTYRQFTDLVECFGAGLLDFGVKRGDHVGMISDNRKEWMIANVGISGIGAADVPRGSDTMAEEACFILKHDDCALTLAENAERPAGDARLTMGVIEAGGRAHDDMRRGLQWHRATSRHLLVVDPP